MDPSSACSFFLRAVADWSPLFTFYGSGWRRFRDLRWMHGPVVEVAQAMARRNVRRSVWTKSRTDQVCGSKQRQGRAVYPALEQKATIRLQPCLILGTSPAGIFSAENIMIDSD